MDKYNLGKKIKRFRTIRGLSQMRLEIAIKTSAGSLSRMESGRINPTKETLIKIIDALKLNSHEVASLYDIDPENFTKLMRATSAVSKELDLDDVLQTSVDSIAKALDLLIISIFIVRGDGCVYSEKLTKTWFTETFLKILPKTFNTYNVKVDREHIENAIVDSIYNQRDVLVTNLYDATRFAYSENVTNLLVKLMNFKSGLIMPLISDEKSIGCIFYLKDYDDDFELEKPLLNVFNHHIAAAIQNARKYEELKRQVEILKKGQ